MKSELDGGGAIGAFPTVMPRGSGLVLAALLLGAGAACDRAPEWGDPHEPTLFGLTSIDTPRIEPGPDTRTSAGREEAELTDGDRYEDDIHAIQDGYRLYRWYNCSGCHAEGGGSIGPPLWDADWTYGGSPSEIAESIIQGREEGMPAFGGRIPRDHVWRVVAYIRTLEPGGGMIGAGDR